MERKKTTQKNIIGFTLGSNNELKGISIKNNKIISSSTVEDKTIGFTAADWNKVEDKIEIEKNDITDTTTEKTKLQEKARTQIAELKQQLKEKESQLQNIELWQENTRLKQQLEQKEQELQEEVESNEKLMTIFQQTEQMAKEIKYYNQQVEELNNQKK
jgi:hypothetical protein